MRLFSKRVIFSLACLLVIEAVAAEKLSRLSDKKIQAEALATNNSKPW